MVEMIRMTQAINCILASRRYLLRYVPGADMTDVGPVKCIRYAKPMSWETEAFFAVDQEPGVVVAAVRAYKPGPHLIAAYTGSPERVTAVYSDLGYTTTPKEPTETVMERTLESAEEAAERYPVRVARIDSDGGLPCAAGGRHWTTREELTDPAIRCYYIDAGGRVVCWGKCGSLCSAAIRHVWGVHTERDHRRRGFASALMRRIHADAAGTTEKVLLEASPMGDLLYRALGYEALAYKLKFVPKDLHAGTAASP